MKIIIPIFFGVLVRLLFGWNLFNDFLTVMSWSFFIAAPMAAGALTIFYSDIQKVRSLKYRIFMPWATILGIFFVTMILMIEGWACWLMILPLYFIFGSIGGLIAGYFKLRKNKNKERLNISILLLLPFISGPIENALPQHKAIYTTTNTSVIKASAAKIWGNVTAVRTIDKADDHSKLTSWLGFPRPVEAVLDTAAVGGYRKAIFDKGLVFHETVTDYQKEKLMRFSIKANTYEIPSTTLDEHILIGGAYFDMLDGTYELKKRNDGAYNLILYSHFSMKTTFNDYAGLWGHWIMNDIQGNILQIIKKRSES